jgi:hypothetical protein
MKHAQQAGADEHVRALLQRLPEQTFNSPIEVSEAIGRLR